MDKCCGTCRFWEPPEAYRTSGHGVCNGIPYQDETAEAYVEDYESYSAHFYPKATFLCKFYESTETK